MKKFFLTAIILMPTLLLAENGVTISGLSVGVGSLTFTVSWDKPAPASTLTWSDTVWVFVDYNNAGVMKRLPLATGATLTATSAPGIGKVIPVSGNTQGVWVVGNARTTSSFSATVVLPFAGSNVSGACAYASNYPPFGDWNSDGTQLTLTGTAPYTLHLEGPLANDPVILNNVYTLPDGYTLASFTDATGAPGIIRCKPSTAPTTLMPSASPVCAGVSATLTASGGIVGSSALYQWGSGNVGANILGTSSITTYLVTPTSSTTYWVRRVSTDGCGVTTAATCAVMVTPAFTQNNPAAATICYNTTNTFSVAAPSGGSGAVTYLWEQSSNNSDWAAATGTNNTQNYTTPSLTTNTYYRRKAAAATCGGTITTSSALVTVTPTFTQDNPAIASICNTTTHTFNVAVPTGGSGAVTYLWEQSSDNSDWATATGTNNTQNYTTPQLTTNTYYRRKAAAATCGGTITTNSALVTVNAIPAAPTSASSNSRCGSGTVTFSATTASGCTIDWYTSSTGTATSATTATSYSPSLTATTTLYAQSRNTTSGCASTATRLAVTATVNALPTTTSLTASTATICNGAAATLTAAGASAASYSFDNGSTWQTATTKTVAPTTTTTYTLKVSSSAGCTSTDSKTATVTVTPTNTVTLYSGSTNTSAAMTVAMTSIVYTTSGATGVTSSGLPSGVSAAYSSNKITISGTPSATGTFNYSATLTGGCGVVATSGKITVALPPIPTPEGSGTQTWTCGTQTWSGPLQKTISGISATTDLGITDPPSSCMYRSSGIYSGSGYLYNWICVQNNASTKLCESPWRVPTMTDFVNLSTCYGGSGSNETNTTVRDNILNSWGGVYAGLGYSTSINATGAGSFYFSSTEYSATQGYCFILDSSDNVRPQGNAYKRGGLQVRCVK